MKILKDIIKSTLTDVNLTNFMPKIRINVNPHDNYPTGPKHVGIGQGRLSRPLFVADCSQSVTVATKVASVRKTV